MKNKRLVSGIVVFLLFTTAIYPQRNWKTVFENKINFQIEEQIDKNSIVYKDDLLYFSQKSIYKEFTRKKFILEMASYFKNENLDISKFSYIINHVVYHANDDVYRVEAVEFYNVNNELIYREDSKSLKWFKCSKGSLEEKVINAVIENLEF